MSEGGEEVMETAGARAGLLEALRNGHEGARETVDADADDATEVEEVLWKLIPLSLREVER